MAWPRQQRSHWGLRLTQNAHFSLMTHTKQVLLVSFCDITAGIKASFQTQDAHTHGLTDGRTERQSDVEDEIVI